MKRLLLTKAKNLIFSGFVLFSLLFAACENPIIREILEFKTVSFNSNGGSDVPDQSMIKGQKVKLPADPEKAGFIFNGWYLDNNDFNLEWDFDIAPTKDMTLHAMWRSYGITLYPDKIDFISQEAGYLSAESVTVEVTNTVAKPTGELTITLTGTGAASFTLSDESLASLKPGETGSFSVSYAPALPVGTYSAAVTVTNGINVSASANLSFTVTPTLIYSAAVSITAPMTGAAPTTAAAGEGNFSIGEVAWSPDHNTFRPETRYTASVTLTANENYAFAENVSAEANKSPAAVTNNSGKTLSFSYEFEATSVNVVTDIVILTPAQLNYTHGDTLAPAGLVVKIYYDDGSAQEVALDSFSSMGVSTTPANGEVLSHSVNNNTELTVSAGACSVSAGTLTVDKKALIITGAEHTKTYDGGTSADGVIVTLDGVISGDLVYAIVTAAYTSANAETKNINITVNLTGADAANYTITQTGTFTVAGITKADPVVTWPADLTAAIGQTLADISLSSYTNSTGTPGSLSWTMPAASVGAAGVQTHSMTFTPADTANYNTRTQDVMITVNDPGKANPAITQWPTAAAITYGEALSASTLTGGIANAEGSFAWTTPATIPTVTNNGYSVTFTPNDTANYNTLTQIVTITVNKAAGATVTQHAVTGDTTNLSVTVSASLAAGTGQTVEYASNTTNSAPASGWQSSGTFTLAVNTVYYVFARSASNNNYNAGAPGAGLQAAFYTVTFNKNGGDADANPASRTVFVNDTVTAPTAPARAGYTFTGWYKEAACQNIWDFTAEKVTGIITLYAGWEAQPGNAGITLSVESIFNGTPSPSLNNIKLSKTGVNKTQTITVTGSYSSIQWEVAGVGVYAGSFVTGSGASFTLDANNEKYGTLGGHTLMLTVYIDGNPYMVNIRFTIEN